MDAPQIGRESTIYALREEIPGLGETISIDVKHKPTLSGGVLLAHLSRTDQQRGQSVGH